MRAPWHEFSVHSRGIGFESRSPKTEWQGIAEEKVQGWDQFELMAATGGRHLSVARHKLKLRRVYTEIEGKPGSRDVRGEPFVTAFHCMFKETVDYIWHSEDLCAVRVLDTPSAFVLLRDKEMPSKGWAIDRLALVCDLSFAPRKEKQEASMSSSDLTM